MSLESEIRGRRAFDEYWAKKLKTSEFLRGLDARKDGTYLKFKAEELKKFQRGFQAGWNSEH